MFFQQSTGAQSHQKLLPFFVSLFSRLKKICAAVCAGFDPLDDFLADACGLFPPLRGVGNIFKTFPRIFLPSSRKEIRTLAP